MLNKILVATDINKTTQELVKHTSAKRKPFSEKELKKIITFYKEYSLKHFFIYLDSLKGGSFYKVQRNSSREIKEIILKNRANEIVEVLSYKYPENGYLRHKDFKDEVISRWNN